VVGGKAPTTVRRSTLTVTPHKGTMIPIEDVMDEIVAEEVTEVAGQTPHVEDPIFWEVVGEYGYPELSHPIHVKITVYQPKES
jgi:hypothetical protein